MNPKGVGEMTITEVKRNKKQYLPLLLLADEQENMIDRYLERGAMYVLDDDGVKAECVVTDEGNGILEIKNIATDLAHQRKGYGKVLIDFVALTYAGKFSVLQVGTGDSPLTIPFYESCGFVRSHTVPNFFTDNYDHPIIEDGVQLVDMVYLRRLLKNEQIAAWKAEEEIAHIHGWDFSHIDGRYTEQDDLPWDYRVIIEEHLTPDMKILDIDTGGGEFLLSLNHPHENTAAMENYPPNVELCREVLLPLGIDFRSGDGKGKLPFDNGSFDMVINRHGDFNAEEIYRVLKPGGLFITQQVGAENDRELVELLCGKTPVPFPDQYLELTSRAFENAGFTILRGEEVFRPIRFFDVGALVWFARIIQWEFPDFSVDTHLENLLNAQRILEEQGSIDGSIHRFLLVARKEKRND